MRNNWLPYRPYGLWFYLHDFCLLSFFVLLFLVYHQNHTWYAEILVIIITKN